MKKSLLALLLFLSSFNIFAQDSTNASKDDVVTISTNLGDIVILLYNETPLHRKNFLKLATEGYYNGTTFHRIIDGFMIQGGDPFSKDSAQKHNAGRGGPGYTIPAEFNPNLTHNYGAVAAARMGDAVNPKKESSGSQFYIVENKEGTHFLDKGYTVFGQVIKGMDVVENIAKQSKNSMDRPLKDITMTIKVKSMKKKKIAKKYKTDFYKKS